MTVQHSETPTSNPLQPSTTPSAESVSTATAESTTNASSSANEAGNFDGIARETKVREGGDMIEIN